MIGWNEIDKRQYGDLQHVPAETLVIMYHEMKYEVDAVLPEGREQAARRNGLERIIPHLRAKGYGWIIDGEAPETVCAGDSEAEGIETPQSAAGEGTGGIPGHCEGVLADSVEAA